MDDEAKAALELTSEQLQAMKAAGQPGVVAKRPRDLNRMATSIVQDSTERPTTASSIPVSVEDFNEVTFSGVLTSTAARVDPASMVTVS